MSDEADAIAGVRARRHRTCCASRPGEHHSATCALNRGVPNRQSDTHGEPRCGTTELLVSQCGCRAHRGSPPPRPATPDPFESATDLVDLSGPGPWVTASYDGECSRCDGAIWIGDQIRADGCGGWECCT